MHIIITLPFLIKTESVTANTRRKVLHTYGRYYVRNTIKHCLFFKVASEVIQETEEGEISDDGKSDEGNCFGMCYH